MYAYYCNNLTPGKARCSRIGTFTSPHALYGKPCCCAACAKRVGKGATYSGKTGPVEIGRRKRRTPKETPPPVENINPTENECESADDPENAENEREQKHQEVLSLPQISRESFKTLKRTD